MKRIEEKIEEIKTYLDELNEIIPNEFNKYRHSNIIKAACERYVEKIMEAVTDLAFLIIKLKKFELPEDDIDSFRILKCEKIIDDELFNKLKLAKGMRNIIAHQYGKIDDKVIFDSITNKLINDINMFLKIIEKRN